MGKMGSGKTTAAQYLVEKYKFTQVSFAARLKEIATKACRMKEKDRELLQNLGSMIRDDVPTYWLDVIKKRVEAEPEASFVLDDLRFKNELEMLLKLGFLVIRLATPREHRFERMGIPLPPTPTEQENHISETDLDKTIPLYTYTNMGSKEGLQVFVEHVIQDYRSLWAQQDEIFTRAYAPTEWLEQQGIT